MQCAEEVRTIIEQIDTRYKNDHDKTRSTQINKEIGEMVEQKNILFFNLVRQFAEMVPDEDTKKENGSEEQENGRKKLKEKRSEEQKIKKRYLN